MALKQLIYQSRPSAPFSSKDLVSILRHARMINELVKVTGALIFTRRYFVQVLEGGSEAINQIYSRLGRDERHHDLKLISYRSIQERRFPKWSMALVTPKELDLRAVRSVTEEAWVPETMEPDALVNLMQDLVFKTQAQEAQVKRSA